MCALLAPPPCSFSCHTQLGDKNDLIKKGIAPHEATSKLAGGVKQLLDATKDWVDDGIRLADA